MHLEFDLHQGSIWARAEQIRCVHNIGAPWRQCNLRAEKLEDHNAKAAYGQIRCVQTTVCPRYTRVVKWPDKQGAFGCACRLTSPGWCEQQETHPTRWANLALPVEQAKPRLHELCNVLAKKPNTYLAQNFVNILLNFCCSLVVFVLYFCMRNPTQYNFPVYNFGINHVVIWDCLKFQILKNQVWELETSTGLSKCSDMKDLSTTKF
jgi:hypothetical protein